MTDDDPAGADTAIWFDLDGTLVQYERDFDRIVSDALVAAGVRSPPEGAYEAFSERIFSALEACEPDPVERSYEHVTDVCSLSMSPAEAAEAHLEIEVEATAVPEGARETVEAVRERAPVGVLSNGAGDLQRAKLAHHDLDELFDAVVISNEVEVRKPDPEIFAIAAERIDADRHVYVADEYETDVRPAQGAGWDAVHVRNDDGPDASVDRLASLRALLL